jgi:hypothetical protein
MGSSIPTGFLIAIVVCTTLFSSIAIATGWAYGLGVLN